MAGMFYTATSFNRPLEGWDVGGVTDMNHMFVEADSLEQVPSWKVEDHDSDDDGY
jgi:surface protein